MATYPDQSLTNAQEFSYTTSPKTASGGAAPLDGNISFVITPSGIITINGTQPFGGNFTGNIIAQGVGTATVVANDTSVGVPLSETFHVIVTADPAVTFGFVFSTPVAKS